MSREIDYGWTDHVYGDEDKLVERLKKEFSFINNIHCAGKYDIEDKTLSKAELKTFLWAAYNYCMAVHYVGAGVEPGSILKHPDFLTINNYKVGYAGKCRSYGRPEKGGTFAISMSFKYYEDWGFVQTLETLYHEIAHLTYFDHSDEFWAEGQRIGFGLKPSGVKGRPAKFERYCEVCDFSYPSVSRPSKYYVCPECWPYNGPKPNYNTWLVLPSEEKSFMKIRKYTGPDILL
jgi:hypothetical protein